MREFTPTESVMLFWRDDPERLQYHPDSCYFEKAEDAIRWAFEKLNGGQRWSAYIRFESDHEKVQISELEEHYRRLPKE